MTPNRSTRLGVFPSILYRSWTPPHARALARLKSSDAEPRAIQMPFARSITFSSLAVWIALIGACSGSSASERRAAPSRPAPLPGEGAPAAPPEAASGRRLVRDRRPAGRLRARSNRSRDPRRRAHATRDRRPPASASDRSERSRAAARAVRSGGEPAKFPLKKGPRWGPRSGGHGWAVVLIAQSQVVSSAREIASRKVFFSSSPQ